MTLSSTGREGSHSNNAGWEAGWEAYRELGEAEGDAAGLAWGQGAKGRATPAHLAAVQRKLQHRLVKRPLLQGGDLSVGADVPTRAPSPKAQRSK